MKVFVETPRLILREIIPADTIHLFELDSDPKVHLFLGNNPIHTMGDASTSLNSIRNQYLENGIGRWAIIEKETNTFIGWAGIKLNKNTINNYSNYYDLGYRLLFKYWGKGFATEAAKATLIYGFSELKIIQLFAIADIRNVASKNILLKTGFQLVETFDLEGTPHYWFKIDNSKH
jgi:RimJ/RimL family protein N-acetyltransferase